MLRHFLNQVIKMKDENKETGLFTETGSTCLSCHKLIVLGQHPFTNLSWMNSSNQSDKNALTCLLSYFAQLCRHRQNSGVESMDYYKMIEFAPIPTTSENINIHPPDIADQIKQLYVKLVNQWQKLSSEKALSSLLPTGVALVNIFDIGSCEAPQDLLPFINKYCRRTLNIACYDREQHSRTLVEEFTEGSSDQYHSTKHKLVKQLCGIHKNNPIVLTAIDQKPAKEENEQTFLVEALKKEMKVDHVAYVQRVYRRLNSNLRDL